MKSKILYTLGLAGLVLSGSASAQDWNSPTPAAMPSQVQPQLHVAIEKDTEKVNFVNTNNDPFVFTRVYVLKYADPYEIRPYVMGAVRSRRVNTNDTKVEAIRFVDGTGMLIVSAEQYRFETKDNGMSIDDIIAKLDRPEMSSSAGRRFYLYFPKYFDSATLSSIIRKVGLVGADDITELQGGIDSVRADVGLNAMFFYTTPASIKTIEGILAEYDGPTTEAVVKYTIYEMDSENDGNLGVDFQAWKNGPGTDLFSAGSRYSNGWDFANNDVANKYVKNAHSSFINFNPKWNSKYLDFLVAKSKAKVVSSGSLSIMNNVEANISATTRIPVISDGDQIANRAEIGSFLQVTGDFDAGDYVLAAVDQYTGLAISIKGSGSMTVGKSTVNNYSASKNYYFLSLDKNTTAYFERADGKNLGKECRAFDVVVTDNAGAEVNNYSTDNQYTIYRDKTRKTINTEYGFVLTMTPQVCENVTNINIAMEETSLIGFKSNGEPRTSRCDLKTQIQVDNKGGMFYIGGLDRQAVVRSVSKVPFLGDIPGLGWVFSAEAEMTKKSHLVAVLEVSPVTPTTAAPKAVADDIKGVKEKIEKSGIKGKYIDENDYGFDQFFLDKDKKSFNF